MCILIRNRNSMSKGVMDFMNVRVNPPVMQEAVAPVETEIFYQHAEEDLRNDLFPICVIG